MTITEVQVKHVYSDTTKPVKAKVSVVIDKELILHNIRVIEKVDNGQKKKFIAFPSQKVTSIGDNNEPVTGYFDIYHPITSEARVKFESAIYKAVDNYIAKQEAEKETKKGE